MVAETRKEARVEAIIEVDKNNERVFIILFLFPDRRYVLCTMRVYNCTLPLGYKKSTMYS